MGDAAPIGPIRTDEGIKVDDDAGKLKRQESGGMRHRQGVDCSIGSIESPMFQTEIPAGAPSAFDESAGKLVGPMTSCAWEWICSSLLTECVCEDSEYLERLRSKAWLRIDLCVRVWGTPSHQNLFSKERRPLTLRLGDRLQHPRVWSFAWLVIPSM